MIIKLNYLINLNNEVTSSDVWMKAISPVVQSSDLIPQVLFFLLSRHSLSENQVLVLGVRQAHVVREICYHDLFIDVVFFKKFRLFFFKTPEHSYVVCCRIHQTQVVHISGFLHVFISVQYFHSGSTIHMICCKRERFGSRVSYYRVL